MILSSVVQASEGWVFFMVFGVETSPGFFRAHNMLMEEIPYNQLTCIETHGNNGMFTISTGSFHQQYVELLGN